MSGHQPMNSKKVQTHAYTKLVHLIHSTNPSSLINKQQYARDIDYSSMKESLSTSERNETMLSSSRNNYSHNSLLKSKQHHHLSLQVLSTTNLTTAYSTPLVKQQAEVLPQIFFKNKSISDSSRLIGLQSASKNSYHKLRSNIKVAPLQLTPRYSSSRKSENQLFKEAMSKKPSNILKQASYKILQTLAPMTAVYGTQGIVEKNQMQSPHAQKVQQSLQIARSEDILSRLDKCYPRLASQLIKDMNNDKKQNINQLEKIQKKAREAAWFLDSTYN